ncbi:CesT family type III secretion system chaperone [Pseudomonas tolaasii]|uniref:CesT family type III secretion system chaperone n=1 Tax=Pseudomonas tolaasii TaxID=29442 RepID=UPI001C52E9EB|nr:CesT family type III secretion system chaperone [Pseudomonas tolaasii]QXQ19548.1 type III secretion system chaperone [Pseudomonas tolaasii]
MSERVIRWAQGTQTQLTLYEDNSKISLQRQAAAFVLGAQLTEPPPSPSNLHTWMRLGYSSLNHFKGALAIAPEDGALWLLQTLSPSSSHEQLLAELESLLNQRDSWRAMAARLTKPAHTSIPRLLSPQPY